MQACGALLSKPLSRGKPQSSDMVYVLERRGVRGQGLGEELVREELQAKLL